MTATSRLSRPRPAVATKWLTIGLFVLPALVLYAVFVILPVLQAMQYSLYKWNGIAPLTDFVGLQNYAIALRNDVFTTSVGNNLLILVLSLAIQIPFSLALAVLLNRRFRGRAALRLLFFLPYVLSEAVTGIVFTLMLQPDSVVDCEPHRHRPAGTHPGLAGRLDARDDHAVRAHLVEVLRLPHDHHACRSAGHSPRARRGRPDRRRRPAPVFPVRHVAPARTDDPGVGVPVDDRRTAAVRDGLGDDRRRPASTPRARWPSRCSRLASAATSSGTAAPWL